MALAETARLIASLELKDQFSAPAKRIEGSLGSLDRKFADTSSRAYKAGQQVGNGIRNAARLAAGAAVLVGTVGAGIVAKSIKAASSLNEVVSKVGVVFKDQAKSVLAFGKTSADALGLSETAALSAAATYGNLFVSMGLSSKASATMSKSLVKLASDLASFNDIEPEEALEKLRAGLTGEAEPLKTLGINLNEQTLKAKALELGLVKLAKGQKTYTAVLSPAVKAQAAYALIMEQSKTSQGDFGRTQDGLANQTRKLRANFTDLLTTLGTPVLPKIAGIFKRINAELKNNQPTVAKLGDTIAGLFSDKNIEAGFGFIKSSFETVKAAAPILQETAKATLGIVQTAVSVFKSLPPEVQKLAVGAFAINKLTGGLVTNLAGGLFDVLNKARGASPANPVFVSDISGGLGGAAGGAGKLATVANLVTKVAIVGMAAEVASLLARPIQDLGGDIHQMIFGGRDDPLASFGKAWDDWRRNADWPFGQKNAPAWAGGGPDPGAGVPIGTSLGTALGKALAAAQGSAAVTVTGFDTRYGQSVAKTAMYAAQQTAHFADVMKIATGAFRQAIDNLRHASKPADIRKAIERALGLVVTGHKGNVENTKDVLSALKAQLKNTHDPQLQRELRSAIAKVEHKITGREYAQKQISAAEKLLRDGKVTQSDLKNIAGIEKALKDRGLPHAADVISGKVKEAQRAQVTAQNQMKTVLQHKKFDPKINITNNVSTSVSINALSGAVLTVRRYGNRYAFNNG